LEDAATLLALSGGAPLGAVSWSEGTELDERRSVLEGLANPGQLDPVTLVERWKGLSPQIWHTVAYKWLGDLLAVRLNGKVQFNRDFADVLVQLGTQVNLSRLLALAKIHADAGRTLMHPLNRALQQEAWLIQYRHLFD
jgi:DNA polymerase-3 subunit delta'